MLPTRARRLLERTICGMLSWTRAQTLWILVQAFWTKPILTQNIKCLSMCSVVVVGCGSRFSLLINYLVGCEVARLLTFGSGTKTFCRKWYSAIVI